MCSISLALTDAFLRILDVFRSYFIFRWKPYNNLSITLVASEEPNDYPLDNLSEDEIREWVLQGHYRRCPKLDYFKWRVFHISPNTVLKRLPIENCRCESHVMQLVSAYTTIPVPKVKGYYAFNSSDGVLLMEYVEGIDLNHAWPHMNFLQKLRVAWTVRGYIQQLRRIPLSHPNVPGPIDGAGGSYVCQGPFFPEDGAGPFASYSDLVSWHTRKREIQREIQNKLGSPDPIAPFDGSRPLVVTHNDLNMTNIRIGGDGTVWLLDWGRSGAFPDWFEYCGIRGLEERYPASWNRMIGLMAGWYAKQYEFMLGIEVALSSPFIEIYQ